MPAAVLVAAMVAASCSEPEPVAGPEESATATPDACAGDDLLDCARASTLSVNVPDSPESATGTPITIGMINQENTPVGSFPELSLAAQSAITFVNQQLGGIDGHPIELLVCNTNFSVEGSTSCAQQMVEAQVPVVMGGIDVFGNGIDVLADNGIPFVGGIPVSAQAAEASNSFQWSGGVQGATVAMANYAADTLDADHVAIVFQDFGPISQSAAAAEALLEGAGVSVTLVPFPVMATDLAAPIQIAAADDPDAMMILVADTGCKGAYAALEAQQIEAQPLFTGACAASSIVDSLEPSATEGVVYTVEAPIPDGDVDPDGELYVSVVNEYGEGLDPRGAGTVTFQSFMNLFMVMRELGADDISTESITQAIAGKVDAPGFMGHDYTCDRDQFDGFPATCSPQQIMVEMHDRKLEQISDWVDVGAIARD